MILIEFNFYRYKRNLYDMIEIGKNYDFMVDKVCDKNCSVCLDKKFMIYWNWNLVCVR